jgi:Fusaric acid resistance protein-like
MRTVNRAGLRRFLGVGLRTVGSTLPSLGLYAATGAPRFMSAVLLALCLAAPYDPDTQLYTVPLLCASAALITLLIAIGYVTLDSPIAYTLLCAGMGFFMIYARQVEARLERVAPWIFIAALYSFTRLRGQPPAVLGETLALVPLAALSASLACFILFPTAPPPAFRAAARDLWAAWRVHGHPLRGGRQVVGEVWAFRDPIVRHSVRMAGIVALASVVGLAWHRPHAEWLIFSATAVARPDLSLSLARATQRAGGVTLGVVVGALLLHGLPYLPVLYAVMAVLLIFLMLAFTNYALGVAVRSMLAVIGGLAFAHAGVAAGVATGWVRVENIYVGIGIGVLGRLVLWPRQPPASDGAPRPP